MIIVLEPDIAPREIQVIADRVAQLGCTTMPIEGAERSVLAVLGTAGFDPRELRGLPGVVQVLRVGRPYKLASREVKHDATIVRVGDVIIGGDHVVVIAGPSSVESREMIFETAQRAAECGATVLRGGAFRPRTSPYSFQGLGEQGLEYLRAAGDAFGLLVVTEVMSADQVPLVGRYADILQIGTRNMQNVPLLKAVGQTDIPVVLKRGIAATVDEWLQAAEYVLAPGINTRVILCERGIRTFEPSTRYTLDLSAIVVLRERTHLPIIVDPSHGTGQRSFVPPMARAAVAAGADGVMVEVHPDPDRALSDGPQSLRFPELRSLVRDLQTIAPVVGRRLDLRTTRPAPVVKREADKEPEARCAFQGEHGAFSEKAARQVFGPDVSVLPCPSFRAVFEAVVRGRSPYGIIPIENSLGGTIRENYDLLLEHAVTVVGEHKLRVVHNLIANRGARLADIRKIYAHPQAAAQCDLLLRAHPEWVVYQVYDTAGSAKMIQDEAAMDGAAIAGAIVADELDMIVLQRGIESHPENYTRFLVLAPEGTEALAGAALNKSSLVYATPDEPGALLETLQVFARHRINLTRLESRPIPGRPWDYRFHVDLSGRPTVEMLAELREHTTELKVLGIYPA